MLPLGRYDYWHNRTPEDFKDDFSSGMERLHDQGFHYMSFEYEESSRLEFSRKKCIVCKTPLAGKRYLLLGVHEESEESEIVGYGCVDCLHYHANGEVSHYMVENKLQTA